MMVNAIKQRVGGELWQENGRCAVLLREQKPEKGAADSIYLRYAFTVQGTEAPFFPESLLDDWGNEIKRLKLYEWVREHGPQFPRAEVFGFTLAGEEMQRFLREFELYAKLRCYAYPTKETPLPEGVLVQAVLLPDGSVTEPVKVKRPSEVKRPLGGIQASWWLVPPDSETFDFSLLKPPSGVDY